MYNTPMLTALTLLGLLVLFYALGLCADLVITNIRDIGRKLGLPIFFLGLLLGLLTSLPELGVGINALVQDVPSISVGNLFGGVLVLVCLVLGVSVMLNREIKTDGKTETLWPLLGYIALPLLLGLRGYIGFWSGLGLVVLYPAVLVYLYLARDPSSTHSSDSPRSLIIKELILALAGVTGVMLLSNLIVRMTLPILTTFGVPAFLVGLIVYSLGTNLPELIVAIRSWKRNVKELSFSNILGSAITNPALLGAFAVVRELPVRVDFSYFILVVATLIALGLFLRFYRTGRKLTRNEGLALIAVYVVFAVFQIPAFSAFASSLTYGQ